MSSSLRLQSAQWEVWLSTSQQRARPNRWQVSKSQQVYRSILWDSFNGDTWRGLWIKEEMKDDPVSKQDWNIITATYVKSSKYFNLKINL